MKSIIDEYNIDDGRMEPLQLAILAALAEEEDNVKLFDERAEEIPFDEETDLVGITVDSFNARRAYQISEKYRAKGVQVVLGGIHPTVLPEESEKYADAIVIGDAEPVWKMVLSDAKNHKLKKRYSGKFTIPQEGVFPRRDLFKNKGYLPVSLIQFSRGCKFRCSFCSVSEFFQNSHQCRKIDDVLYEIEKDNLKTLLFVDDNMVSNKALLKDLLRELIPYKLKWASQSSIDMVYDLEMMDLMAQSGCIGNLVGFESINVNSLKWFRKAPNLRNFDKYYEALEIFRDYGFLTWASFMFGNDFDTIDSLQETVEYAVKMKFTLAFFHILMPYPGTQIYEQFKAEDRLLYDGCWWNHDDYKYNSATFIPKLISSEKLSEITIQANKDFYSIPSIGKRLLDTKTNMRNLINFMIFSKFNYILRATST